MSGTRSSTSVLNGNSHRASPPRVPLRNSPTVSFYGVTPIGGRRERRRCDDRTADRIAAALALIRQTDEHWHGLAIALWHGPGCRAARPLGGPGGADGPAGALPGRGDGQQAAGVLTPRTRRQQPPPLFRVSLSGSSTAASRSDPGAAPHTSCRPRVLMTRAAVPADNPTNRSVSSASVVSRIKSRRTPSRPSLACVSCQGDRAVSR